MEISNQFFKWIQNKLLLIVLISLITLIIIGTYSSRYQPFEKEFIGIEFRLNEEVYTEKLLIFDGKLSDPIIGNKRFKGRIIYDKAIYETTLRFKNNSAYIFVFENKPKSNQVLSDILTDDNFEKFAITIHEKTSDNTASWNSTTGLVFVTPASDKEMGCKLFEELSLRE